MKILIYDIETTPITGYAWSTWNTNIIEVTKDWQMICFAYKWYGQKKTYFVRPPEGDPYNDIEMVKTLWGLFDEADVVIGHNVDKFDVKKANALFIRHGLTPPAPFRTIDTLKIARKNFANTSNRLDSLGDTLGLGRKTPGAGYMKLFKGCMLEDNPRAWKLMKKYNLQDVNLTEKLYKKLLPWIKAHPIDLEKSTGCTNCGSHDLQARGYRETRSFRYRRFRCNSCGTWMSERTHDKSIGKPEYV